MQNSPRNQNRMNDIVKASRSEQANLLIGAAFIYAAGDLLKV